MATVFCNRADRSIDEAQCCQTVIATTSRTDLATCQACACGKKLAALSPYQPHVDEKENATLRGAHDALPMVLGYTISRYPEEHRPSLNFLGMVARRFGFDGGPEPLTRAALASGLTVCAHNGSHVVELNEAARHMARA